MIIPRRDLGESSQESCTINIYINNDVQGFNNSILVDSEVKMGDLGVNLCLKDFKMDRGMVRNGVEGEFEKRVGWVLLFSFVILFLSFYNLM
ncbi:hypothetical protein F511_20378 [Dorcoceras hygrometricum]|uniref:Transmembrane protein n=1 Tax=Dorcoceras hygrometricum TaxID=472368 RepID=A0A2Z7CSU2_9LAMI|nr:hypothetical protein F511_20378 [Dorcoceras hygrometricum]